MGIGSSGVVNCANTYLGTANYTVADGYVADRTPIVGGNGPAQLNLNFARNEVLDPRITFSRTSNATRVNAQGLIEYAPHNLFDNSENLLNWVPGSGAGITANATISPDGTSTADLITGASSLGWAVANTIARQPAATLIPSTTYYGSIYVKAETATTVTLQLRDQSTGSTQQTTVTLTGSWQRISANITLGSATTAIGFVLGNADGTFYAWGGQLNIGSLQPYYTTSVKNLLGYSQNFENAAWTKSNSSIDATPVMGPLGFLGAEKLVENTAASVGHYISPIAGLSLVAGQTVTYSVYAKAGERTFVQLIQTGIGPAGANLVAGFNLANGIAGTPNAGTSLIEAKGNGWYRCSFTTPVSASATSTAQIRLALNSTASPSSYTGDGTSGIYIFGAQLSDSASLDPYVYNFGAAPTSSAYYGPRFDYDPVTLAPKGLLIEESRTNLLTYSEQFDNAAWVKASCTTIADTAIAPDGTLTGDTFTTALTNHALYASVTVTASTTYTFSWYAKAGTITPKYSVYNATGAADIISPSVYPTGTPAGDGWFRYSATFTTPVGCIAVNVYPVRDSGTTGTIYLWGAQLEAGAFPTSYIPTTSAQVTRTADNASMTGTNFSSWYNQSEGTVACESLVTGVRTSDYTYWRIDDNTNTNRIQSGTGASVTLGNAFIITNNISQGNNIVNVNPTSITKTAFAIATNNTVNSANGVIGTVDTTASLPTVNQLMLGRDSTAGYINGYIKSFKYFNKRLLNSYLQSLTQ